MKEVVVAIFPDERSALCGSSALQALHSRGEMRLYSATVVVKHRDGVRMRAGSERKPLGMLVGMVCGGLIGGLGGPVTAIAGACVGISSGLVYDIFGGALDIDFVDEVGAELEPGSFGVIAELDETGTTPVDTRLAAYGGRVLRRVRGEWLGEQVNGQAGQAVMTPAVLTPAVLTGSQAMPAQIGRLSAKTAA